MNILVINCGSSSIKYQLYSVQADGTMQVLAKGIVEKIGVDGSYLKYETGSVKLQKDAPISSYRDGFKLILQVLLDQSHGILNDLNEITAVGHRAVHGGEFTRSAIVTDEVIHKIEEYASLAPLHNPVNLIGIREAMRVLPAIPHIAVFDTAFHQTMLPEAYFYALPYEFFEKNRIRRYGFHGTSLKYVTQRAIELLLSPIEKMKMVICHLGSGITVAAVSGGKSVDASTGFTPLAGPLMGTRCGDLDPGLVLYLQRELRLSLEQVDQLLNREGGLLGISGVSSDMRVIIDKAKEGDMRCQLALEMFVYQVKKYIGAYAAAMGGLDALVFTAGVGENSPLIRSMICEGLEFLGIELEKGRNEETFAREGFISQDLSPVKVMVVPTNEELMIALDTLAFL